METQSSRRSVRRMGDTVGAGTPARHHTPAPRRQAETARRTALAARIACQDYANDLLADGQTDRAVTFLAPLMGTLEAVAFTGDPARLLSDAMLADDEQDVWREKYRRGDASAGQYRWHLLRQLRYTLAELRVVVP